MNSLDLPSDQHLVHREQLPLSSAYVAPRTPVEQQLVEIWRSVLNMDFVGVEDDYFDLGGDSLLATAIFGRIKQTFNIDLPMASLIEAPSIALLASRIDAPVAADLPRSSQI
jgi:acyl carrier protein